MPARASPGIPEVGVGSFSLRRPAKSVGCNRLTIAEWNVQKLLDRSNSSRPERQTALVAKELARYKFDMAALSETGPVGYDNIMGQGYTFIWSGKGEADRREAGVALAVKNSILRELEQEPTPINDSMISTRLPLKKKAYATILSVYAPTMTNPEDKKEELTRGKLFLKCRRMTD